MADAPSFLGTPMDAPTVIDGARDPSGMVTNRVKFDAKDTLVFIEPSSTPFMTIVNALRDRRTATQYRYDHFQKKPLPRVITLTAASTSGATTATVSATEGDNVKANDMLLNTTTREVVLCTAESAGTLTIVRQIGGSPPAAMVIGEKLVIMGEAAEDGTGIGARKSTKEENVYNYCQIFKRAIEFTGRQVNTSMWGGSDKNSERRSQAIEFRKDIEFHMLFGRRHSRTGAGGKIQSMMGGAEFFVDNDVWDLNGGIPSENQFVEWLEWIMREGKGGNTFGKGRKWLFAPDRLITIIENFARDRIRYVDPLKSSGLARKLKVGLRVGQFTTSHGEVMLVKTPIFRRGNEDRGVLLDMNHIRYVAHKGRDVRLLENQEANDLDGEREQWFGDISIEFENKYAHSWITNIPV